MALAQRDWRALVEFLLRLLGAPNQLDWARKSPTDCVISSRRT
jgi:hypothetical protein